MVQAKLFACFGVALYLAMPLCSYADYFKCEAPDGSISFQYSPCPAASKENLIERRVGSSSSEHTTQGESDAARQEGIKRYLQQRQLERDIQAPFDEYRKAINAIDSEYEKDRCAIAKRAYANYSGNKDWAHLTRIEREDPNLVYQKREVEKFCR